jgi:hypothetical protein
MAKPFVIKNRSQRIVDELKNQGYLTAYDIAKKVGLSPSCVHSRLGEPSKTVVNTVGLTRLWSHDEVRAVFGWPE